MKEARKDKNLKSEEKGEYKILTKEIKKTFVGKSRRTPYAINLPTFSYAKGYIYTLEVLIAVAVILVSLVFIFRSSPTKPDLDISIIKTQGMDALSFLDAKGTLRKLVFDDNETEIENQLKSYLPKNIGFEAELCTLSCSAVNVPVNETVVALNYFVSGYKESFIGKKIKLWLWRKS